jgi:ribonuclease P protein subunit RPR2
MAKDKSSKGGGPGVPQKHLHSRISFLHQAASYLALSSTGASTEKPSSSASKGIPTAAGGHTRPPRSDDASRLLMHVRGVSRKSQIRLSPNVKHSICKRCDALLIPGMTSSESISNPSKHGKKVWADVLEIKCHRCETVKRFPVGTKRDRADNATLEPSAKDG